MKTFYLGGDVSKGYADFVLIDQDRIQTEPCFRLDDNAKGHTALETLMRKVVMQNPDAQIRLGVESTGGYESNWLKTAYNLSKSLPISSARINPCGIKKFMDADLIRTINDEVSARYIAQYMIAHPDKVHYDQDDQFYSLRRQWTSLSLLKKTTTQLSNNLHSLLYTANPGVLVYCRKGIPGWVSSVLEKYPLASALAKARLATVASIKHVGPVKAEALIRHARSCVASTDDPDMAFTIKQMLLQIKSMSLSISTIEKHLTAKWKDNSEILLVSSVIGIGVMSAIGLILNIRDVRLFPSVKHLASYFGIHPKWKTSGDGEWGYHMSKIGRSQPRSILFMAAMSAVVHNPVIRKLYKKCRRKGMVGLAAIGVCMHKMLRIVYGILKTRQAFDPKIDSRNQQKSTLRVPGVSEQKYEEKLRRYQQAELDVPVSRRQAIKRKRATGPKASVSPSTGSPSPLKKIVAVKAKDNKKICFS